MTNEMLVWAASKAGVRQQKGIRQWRRWLDYWLIRCVHAFVFNSDICLIGHTAHVRSDCHSIIHIIRSHICHAWPGGCGSYVSLQVGSIYLQACTYKSLSLTGFAQV